MGEAGRNTECFVSKAPHLPRKLQIMKVVLLNSLYKIVIQSRFLHLEPDFVKSGF